MGKKRSVLKIFFCHHNFFSVQGVDREVVGAVMEALYNKVYQLTGCFKIRQDDIFD